MRARVPICTNLPRILECSSRLLRSDPEYLQRTARVLSSDCSRCRIIPPGIPQRFRTADSKLPVAFEVVSAFIYRIQKIPHAQQSRTCLALERLNRGVCVSSCLADVCEIRFIDFDHAEQRMRLVG